MGMSTNSISGLASGLDWRNIVDQLISLEHRRVDLIINRKTKYEKQLYAWQDLNKKLLALKTSVEALRKDTSFNLYSISLSSSSSTDPNDLLEAKASEGAISGSYSVEVIQRAMAQKLSSKSFSSKNTPLGASYRGTIILNKKALTVSENDSLIDVCEKINELNCGMKASVVSYSSTDHRLFLTSDTEGSNGIEIAQVGPENVLEAFGLVTSSTTIKNPTSNGAKSSPFWNQNLPLYTILGLNSPITGNVTIGGQPLTIDLSRTLNQIASDIDSLSGVSAEIVSSQVDGKTLYQIQIKGTTSFTDGNNLLQALGILKPTFGKIQEIHRSNNILSKAGGEIANSSTTWQEIDTGGGENNITNGDTILIQGTTHDGIQVSSYYVISNKETDTIQGLLDAIEDAFGNVHASITSEGKIEILDNVAGDSALTVTLIASNEGGGDLDLGDFLPIQEGYSMEVQSGIDAKLKVDGTSIIRNSNQIDDLIPGVVLNLKKAEVGTTITMDVKMDIDGIYNKVNEFVEKYNEVISFISMQSSYDEKNQTAGGDLFGQGTLYSIKSDLIKNLVNKVWAVPSEFSILGTVGINLDNKGNLSIKREILDGYLRTNFNDVRNLFTVNAKTSTPQLQYLTHGMNTLPGTYRVNITQASTRGSVTGNVDLSNGLGGAETITITVGDQSAVIDLQEGLKISQILNSINAELKSSYARVIVGDKPLYADENTTTPITNSTTWANVYDDKGESAGLQNGDTISFTGTTRYGNIVNGSYTIEDINTDTIQGLLSSIEKEFNNEVIASINNEGKIVITDKLNGRSNLTLSILEMRNLNFGTIDVDPAGEDGSHEGRYPLPVVAYASEDNKYIVFSHENYGKINSFTITQANDILLGPDKDGTYSGLDVEGTINGEPATGSGQNLQGNPGTANVDGLVISYTGTDIGDVGSITLTIGVAEYLYRSLFHITDPYEGYLSFKQESIKSNIDRYEREIDSMEASLERKKEMMINQFVAMEKALSKIQTQSSWLSSQIESLNRFWQK